MTDIATQRTTWVGLLVSALLLLPAGWRMVSSPPTYNDLDAANARVVRMALSSFSSSVPMRLSFHVPDSAQWVQIRRRWGDPGYVVFALEASRTTWVIPFNKLDLDVAISGKRGVVAREPARDMVYPYSSLTSDIGLRFTPEAGDDLTVVLTARSPNSMPPGELVIAPYWDSRMKGYAVGVQMSDYFAYVAWGCAGMGLAILVGIAVRGTLRQ